jgi:hypothetical protein
MFEGKGIEEGILAMGSSANSSFIATSVKRAIISANLKSNSNHNRIRECDYCNNKIEILGGRPLNHPEGSLHRCGRPVNYGRELVI